MMEKVLNQLREEMHTRAHQALLRPTEKDLFEYGKVSGIYQGLARAVELIEGITKADKEEEERT